MRKRMNPKWILVVACILLLSSFPGCKKNGQNGDNVELVNPEQAGEFVATVNGEAITVSDMQYYIYNAAMLQLYQLDPTGGSNIQEVDWNQVLSNGKSLSATIKEEALTMAETVLLTIQNGKKAGYQFSDEPKKQIESSLDGFLESYGAETLQLNLTAMGFSSRDAYEKIYERTMQGQSVQTDAQKNLSKYISDVSLLENYRSDDKATVQHVLILTQDGKYEDPLTTANEVLQKAKAGEDFSKLIKDYNEDPGATEAGYTFGPGEMVKEFEEASFALEFGEISDLVKTSYGYHIIKRLPGAAELENYWLEQADIQVNKEQLDNISIKDTMDKIDQAQNTLRTQAEEVNHE